MNKLSKKVSESGLSIAELAEHFGCSTGEIEYKLMFSHYKLTQEELNKFAELLKCEVEDLI